MKKVFVSVLLTLLLIFGFGSIILAESNTIKKSEMSIYYLNGDWKYEKVRIYVEKDQKYLNALNYLVSGENLPIGCYNEFPENFEIEAYELKNKIAYIEIDRSNLNKFDEISFSMNVFKDIISHNIFSFNEEIEKVIITSSGVIQEDVNKSEYFNDEIDLKKEKLVNDKLKELEEKFKGYTQEEIIDYINMNNKLTTSLEIAEAAATYTVVLDPGHGGGDSGAVRSYNGTQYKEKDINLAIALAARNHLLTHSGIRVLMTRSTDISVGINSRYLYANNNNATCFVSVHINANPSTTPKGCTAIYPNNHDISLSKILADLTVDNIVRWSNLSKFSSAYKDYKDLGVLRFSNMPAIISESGFMSNTSDLSYLITTNAKTTIGGQIGYSIWYWLQYWGS